MGEAAKLGSVDGNQVRAVLPSRYIGHLPVEWAGCQRCMLFWLPRAGYGTQDSRREGTGPPMELDMLKSVYFKNKAHFSH